MSVTDKILISPGSKPDPKELLKGLVKILHDGQEGFRTASEDSNDTQLKELFSRFSLQRSKFAGELEAELLTLGEDDPQKEGTTLAGDVHRGWIDFKAALTRHDRAAILKETERGEAAAVKAYNDALEHRELPAPVREAISHQALEIKLAHQEVIKLQAAEARESGT